jgi:hypothetical protein
MFETDITINRHQMRLFDKTVADLAEESLFAPSPGHGHPAAWVMGHLAIVGELGQSMLGGNVTHREWLRLFGPGSSDAVAPAPGLTKQTLVDAVTAAYDGLQKAAAGADPEAMRAPHAVKVLEGTPIETLGQCISHLLTSHFGFHLSQLSSCRRAAGFGKLF